MFRVFFPLLLSGFVLILSQPFAAAQKGLGTSQELESFEIREIVTVEIKEKTFPGIVIAKPGKNFYQIRYYNPTNGKSNTNTFFPPEMKKTNGKGFEPVATEFRTWKSTKGTEAVAKLVFSDGEKVILERKTKAVVVPIELLGPEDIEYLAQMKSRAELLSRTDPSRTGPTPLKELIGMDKDEMLDKIRSDQEQMLTEYEKPNTGMDDEARKEREQRIASEKEELQKLLDAVGTGNTQEAKKRLEEFNERFAKLADGNFESESGLAGTNTSNVKPADTADAQQGIEVNNQEHEFKLAIPPGFRKFKNVSSELTMLHSFVQKNVSEAKIPTIIEIHRTDNLLDASDSRQLSSLRRAVGKPTEKIDFDLFGVESEIWKTQHSVGHLGNYIGYTLFLTVKPEGLRVSIGGQTNKASANLEHLKSIAKSLDIASSRFDAAGFKTEQVDAGQFGSSPSRSYSDYSASDFSRESRRKSQAKGVNFLKISMFILAGGALVLFLYRTFKSDAEPYP